jgi:hypothetical protein
VKSGIGMEQIVVRELTRELIETVRKEARQMRRTLKPLMRRIMSLADAAAYLPENASRKCGVFEAVALYYGAEVFLAQYQRMLEKINFTVYREDAADMLKMIKEIRRRVDEVVDKAYECTK